MNKENQRSCLQFLDKNGIIHRAKLMGERLIWLPDCNTLLAADLHWGKIQTFWHEGIPLAYGVLETDLARLSHAIAETGAERLLVLGDLVHNGALLSQTVIDTVTAWRAMPIVEDLRLEVLQGNPDHHGTAWPAAWRIDVRTAPVLDGFWAFAHEPVKISGHFLWVGRIHPVVQLFDKLDGLRLPCFAIGQNHGLLPAFNLFTGDATVDATEYPGLYAIADGAVIVIREPEQPLSILEF